MEGATEGDTQRHTGTHTGTHTNTHTGTHRHTHTQTHRHTRIQSPQQTHTHEGGCFLLALHPRFVNLACGQLAVPMHIFMPTTLIGLMPYTFMGCQAGTILTRLKSMYATCTHTHTCTLTFSLTPSRTPSHTHARIVLFLCVFRSDVMQPQVIGGLVGIGAVGFLLPALFNALRGNKTRADRA